MSPRLDPGPRRRKTPCCNTGRLSLFGLQALYLLGRFLQWPLEVSFWAVSGWLAGLDTEILRRKGGA